VATLKAYEGTSLALAITVNSSNPDDPQDPSVLLAPATAPFDLFIARTGEYGHQIHLTQFPGTDLMDTTLFLNPNDGSSAANGAWFVNTQGLPFALNVPNYTPWMQETISIDQAFPDLSNFATYGATAQGGVFSGWYNDPFNGPVLPTETVNFGALYSAGANGLLPEPIEGWVGPLVGSAGPCYPTNFGSGPGSSLTERRSRAPRGHR